MRKIGTVLAVGAVAMTSPLCALADSNMVPGPAAANPPIVRTPPSVRTGSVPPGYDIPSTNPSYPRRLRDYSNPNVRYPPAFPRSSIRRR
jgi:hypothetical protein